MYRYLDGLSGLPGFNKNVFQEGSCFGITWLDNSDFYSKVTISVSHLDGAPWCLSFFGAFYHTSDSVRGWAAGIRRGLTEACFFSGGT